MSVIIALCKGGGDFMTVKEYMEILDDNTEIIVKQYPIQRIDSSCNLVERQRGEKNVLIYSRQNYLDYDVKQINTHYNGSVEIICKANPKQESKVIAAMYSLEMRG
jgi:hypothetical protein